MSSEAAKKVIELIEQEIDDADDLAAIGESVVKKSSEEIRKKLAKK